MVDAILCSRRCSITTYRDNEGRISSQLSHNSATDVHSYVFAERNQQKLGMLSPVRPLPLALP
eukprot:scaffold554092_cov47-Prasinocladus_malaysianus.AAC.1